MTIQIKASSEQYFIAVLLKISHIQCDSKHGIIVIILTSFITSKHAITCSWRADSMERRRLKKDREIKGRGRLEQANHALFIASHVDVLRGSSRVPAPRASADLSGKNVDQSQHTLDLGS